MDANYDENFSKAKCVEFLKTCISLACYRDGSSGGCIRMIDITKDGTERTFTQYSDMV
jgi:20S proteasome subunit beta 1